MEINIKNNVDDITYRSELISIPIVYLPSGLGKLVWGLIRTATYVNSSYPLHKLRAH